MSNLVEFVKCIWIIIGIIWRFPGGNQFLIVSAINILLSIAGLFIHIDWRAVSKFFAFVEAVSAIIGVIIFLITGSDIP